MLLATGRMFRSVRPYAEAAGIEDPVVCYQGAVVAEPVVGPLLRHEPIPLELAREAIAAVQAEGYPLNCYVGRRALRRRAHRRRPSRTRRSRTSRCTRSAICSPGSTEPPTKLVAVGDPVELDGLEERMLARFGRRLYISKSLPYFLEFASPEVTKALRARFVAEHLGSPRRRRWRSATARTTSRCSSGPATRSPSRTRTERVLAVADFVCPPVDEEGVAQVIEAYLARRATCCRRLSAIRRSFNRLSFGLLGR